MFAVIIWNHRKKHMEKFGQKHGTYGAYGYYLRLKKKYGRRPDINIIMIDLSKCNTPPDPNKVQRKGEWWCPACQGYRKFKNDTYLNRKVCPICGLSDNDFYVKQYNNLWRKSGQKRTRARKKKEDKND